MSSATASSFRMALLKEWRVDPAVGNGRWPQEVVGGIRSDHKLRTVTFGPYWLPKPRPFAPAAILAVGSAAGQWLRPGLVLKPTDVANAGCLLSFLCVAVVTWEMGTLAA
jgi:hypothetical protein